MELSTMTAFRLFVKLICMIGLTFMITYWLYKFSVEDRDIGVVDYHLLDETGIDYPILSICVNTFPMERPDDNNVITPMAGNDHPEHIQDCNVEQVLHQDWLTLPVKDNNCL